MNIRASAFRTAYKLFPFPLTGDLTSDVQIPNGEQNCEISCVINFYGRTELLRNILTGLSEQSFKKADFEVVLVEDRSGTKEGKEIVKEFRSKLNIKYYFLEENFGVMGYARNFGLSKTKGNFILFLDDDTIILDKDFLSILVNEFNTSGAEAVMPFGSASFCLIKEKYSFHDPYFPTNRCMAYKRETLLELKGFVSEIIGQEDVEFTLRLIAAQKKIHRSNLISYMHPPLITQNTNKAAAVGASFAKLRKRYSFVVWLMLLINGCRDLPKLIFPISTQYKMQGMFSLGFLFGIWYSITGKKMEYN
jgi:glycosyltransferase involved in cell wall biosynthesis